MNQLATDTGVTFGDPRLLALMVALLVVLIGTTALLRWGRASIPPTRRLARALGLVIVATQALMVATALGVVVQLIPRPNGAVGLTLLVVLGIGLAWATRDILPDLIAGVVLMFERRIRKGMWVSGDGFQGSVERRTLRATWLRDSQGHRLAVPNRAMVSAPLVYDAGADTEHEVEVRLEGYAHAAAIRQSLYDVVLSSPWVLAGAAPVVLRDPQDPAVWRVRTKLLEPRFAVQFEGELLERAEDILAAKPARDTPVAPEPEGPL